MNFRKSLRIRKTRTAERIEQGRKKGSFFTVIKTNKRAYLSPYEARVMEEIIKRGGKARVGELVASLEEKQGWASAGIIKRAIRKLEDVGYLEGKEGNKKGRSSVIFIASKVKPVRKEHKKLYEKLLGLKKFREAMRLRYGSKKEREEILKRYS